VERAPPRLAHPRRHRHHRVPRPRGRAGAGSAAAEQHDEEVVGDQERPRRHQRRGAPHAAAAAGSGLSRRRVHLSSLSGIRPLSVSPLLSLERGSEREILEFLACEFGLGGNRGIRIH